MEEKIKALCDKITADKKEYLKAQDFLNSLPSLEAQGITVDILVKDYEDRL
jgi:hypothetical protein